MAEIKNLPATRETQFDPWVGKIPWRRKWLPTSVSVPGEFHGQRSLAGYSPEVCKKLDRTEWLTHTHAHNWVNGKTTCGVSMQWNTTQQQQQILIDVTTWMNLKIIMPSERTQSLYSKKVIIINTTWFYLYKTTEQKPSDKSRSVVA